MTNPTASLLATLVLALASCGGTSTGPDEVPGKPWKDQTREERILTMRHVVFPAMKTDFEGHDPEGYKDMTCCTCHGNGVADRTFTMPNPQLPKLPTTEAGFEAMKRKDPCMVEFMSTVVVPKMAAFLGEAPYDPKTRLGFGCFRCHPKESFPAD